MSRHRGAKPLRRCELLGVISLLSHKGSFYPLSIGNPRSTYRMLSPTFVPARINRPRSQAPLPLHSSEWFPAILGNFERLRTTLSRKRPPAVPPDVVPSRFTAWVKTQYCKGGIPTTTQMQLTSHLQSLAHACSIESQHQTGVSSMGSFRPGAG